MSKQVRVDFARQFAWRANDLGVLIQSAEFIVSNLKLCFFTYNLSTFYDYYKLVDKSDLFLILPSN